MSTRLHDLPYVDEIRFADIIPSAHLHEPVRHSPFRRQARRFDHDAWTIVYIVLLLIALAFLEIIK